MGADIIIWVILLVALVLMGFLTVVVRTLPTATIMLALTAVVLALLLYVAGMKLAAVIELSVSAGLVTAILASAIALLKPEESADHYDSSGAVGAARTPATSGTPETSLTPATSGAPETSLTPAASGTPAPKKNSRLVRYLPLPIIMLLLAVAVLLSVTGIDISLPAVVGDQTAQSVLWGERTLDIVGLTLLILAGVLGVTALIKRREVK